MKNKLRIKFLTILSLVIMISGLTIVKAEAAAPKISKKKITVIKGKKKTLAIKNTKKAVKWKISNKKVATIKKKGKNKVVITGKKPGKAVIKGIIGKKTYKCKVTVKKPVPKTEHQKKVDKMIKENLGGKELKSSTKLPYRVTKLEFIKVNTQKINQEEKDIRANLNVPANVSLFNAVRITVQNNSKKEIALCDCTVEPVMYYNKAESYLTGKIEYDQTEKIGNDPLHLFYDRNPFSYGHGARFIPAKSTKTFTFNIDERDLSHVGALMASVNKNTKFNCRLQPTHGLKEKTKDTPFIDLVCNVTDNLWIYDRQN